MRPWTASRDSGQGYSLAFLNTSGSVHSTFNNCRNGTKIDKLQLQVAKGSLRAVGVHDSLVPIQLRGQKQRQRLLDVCDQKQLKKGLQYQLPREYSIRRDKFGDWYLEVRYIVNVAPALRGAVELPDHPNVFACDPGARAPWSIYISSAQCIDIGVPGDYARMEGLRTKSDELISTIKIRQRKRKRRSRKESNSSKTRTRKEATAMARERNGRKETEGKAPGLYFSQWFLCCCSYFSRQPFSRVLKPHPSDSPRCCSWSSCLPWSALDSRCSSRSCFRLSSSTSLALALVMVFPRHLSLKLTRVPHCLAPTGATATRDRFLVLRSIDASSPYPPLPRLHLATSFRRALPRHVRCSQSPPEGLDPFTSSSLSPGIARPTLLIRHGHYPIRWTVGCSAVVQGGRAHFACVSSLCGRMARGFCNDGTGLAR